MVERTKHIEKGLVLMGKEKREDKRGFEWEGAQSQCRRGDTWLELGKHKKWMNARDTASLVAAGKAVQTESLN